MNEVMRQLRARVSVRAWSGAPIPPDARRAILEAACQAPSAGNMQLYTILDITDPAIKQKLAESCDHQPFIAEADMVLVFLADYQKWVDAFDEAGIAHRRPGAGDLMLAVSDACIAAQNAVTAAWSLGVGSCYIGDVSEHCAYHRALLGLPAYAFPAAMAVFGMPAEGQLERKKPARFPLEDIVMRDVYARKDGRALRAMFAERTQALGYEEWMRRHCARKYDCDFSREMTRSVEEYLETWRSREGEA